MTLFDSHCHLDDTRVLPELDQVLERAQAAGVTRIAAIGCAHDVQTVESALSIARTHPEWISATVGVHPHDAKELDDDLCEAIRRSGADPHVVAIGETGLDYHYDYSPRDRQQEAFRKQVAIAREIGKPLVIHSRSAPDDTLAILKEENAKEVGGIFHCFTENALFAKAALDLGFVVSFSGIVTFKSATEIQEAARTLPLDSLLVETDAPYLAPVPMRGKRNEPSFVVHTANYSAMLRGEDPDAIREATYANTMRVFRLSDPDLAAE